MVKTEERWGALAVRGGLQLVLGIADKNWLTTLFGFEEVLCGTSGKRNHEGFLPCGSRVGSKSETWKLFPSGSFTFLVPTMVGDGGNLLV